MEKHGGSRKNSGRKKVSDKKVQLTIYVVKSKIKKLGGIEETKAKCHEFINKCKINDIDTYKIMLCGACSYFQKDNCNNAYAGHLNVKPEDKDCIYYSSKNN